jgi:hypothetical protein
MTIWLRQHVLAWTTSAALTLAGLRLVTPSMVDLLIDLMSVGLVYLAARLAKV